MEQQLYEQKDATLVYRSVLEAAEELDKDEALELLLSFIHLGLGDEVNLDECSKVVRLILKQNVASLIAADNRHKNAVENGKKGKDSGIKGKEHGKKGGRPRKGETPEEAYERRNPAKTPQETPVTPFNENTGTPIEDNQNPAKTPLKEEGEEYAEVSKEKDIYTEVSKEEYTFEEFSNILKELCLKFIRKHSDYNYLLDINCFKNHYYDNVYRFQRYVNEQMNTDMTVEECCYMITEYAKEQII